jgi:hypothetical protein
LSKRVITLILSLFVLAGLPLVSLYYSFQGASLRKRAMAELGPKGFLPDQLKNSILPGPYLYVITGNCSDTSILKPLIHQFKDEKIRFLFVGDSSYQAMLSPLKLASLKPDGLIKVLSIPADPFGFASGQCDIILANGQSQILHKYNLGSALERTTIVEHLALLVTKK